MIRLKKLIDNVKGVTSIAGKSSVYIDRITCDSKTVRENSLFVALRGSRFNGEDFIDEAINRGASAILVGQDAAEVPHRDCVTFIYAEDPRAILSEIAVKYYGDISKKMFLVGVTGTNGKTTTTYLIESLLRQKNEDAIVIGTINYRFADRVIPAVNTTPGILDLYSLLTSASKKGIKNAVLEVSSHSLEQRRVDTLKFDIAVFTNLTRDHLDYHRDMETYLSSKLKLFTKIKNGGYAVVNTDDPSSEKILNVARRESSVNIVTYGVETEADVRADNIRLSLDNLNFQITDIYGNGRPGASIDISSCLIGYHNVYNILASIACGIAMGLNLKEIKKGIEALSGLPGRLERIDCGQEFYVFVDYAHTEDSLENVLKALRQLSPSRILTVFGCGGNRDRSKRPVMGRIASEFSDNIFITSDNPRGEAPETIIRDIIDGIPPEKNNFVIEPDRFKAINAAIKAAGKGDIVLVAGKGHERYQVFKNTTIPFDDREVVRRILME